MYNAKFKNVEGTDIVLTKTSTFTKNKLKTEGRAGRLKHSATTQQNRSLLSFYNFFIHRN